MSHETSATGLSQYSKRSGLRKGARDWWVGVWSSHFSRLSSYGFFWNCVSGRHWHFYSLHPFFFFHALFLVRPRKRAKKNGAARRGAGFSANRRRGMNENWVAYESVRCIRTTMLDGSARKNPPRHHRSPLHQNGRNAPNDVEYAL